MKKSHKNREDIAAGLLEIGAIKLNVHDPFTWSSGWKSPIYCDNRMTLSHPHLRSMILEEFKTTIRTQEMTPDSIAGVATGGIPYATLIADSMDLPLGYVRSNAKAHGQKNQVEGDFTPGSDCLVIEDLVSTGGSSMKAVVALRDVGIVVKNVICIFSYGFEQAEVLFQNGDCNYFSLIDYHVLFKMATQHDYIHSDQIETLNRWREDPANWKNTGV